MAVLFTDIVYVPLGMWLANLLYYLFWLHIVYTSLPVSGSRNYCLSGKIKYFSYKRKHWLKRSTFVIFFFTAKEKRDFWDLPHEYFMNYLRKSLRDEWLKIGDSVVWWTNSIPAIVPMAAIFNYCDIANMGR